ncbi:hypothetical protein Vadar_029103 [Vaccinium darrowii]|uniref:Uncharacterized protein n=1 Tax=Vaccinium darrowii TaxID=229202 RepID=A0ACB7YGL3_9ERIC|nr:hypothetical protein Vadar_029103 [Vaccinium darrowii]
MSDPSDLEEVGSESSISGAGSEFAEERLDFPPPNALPEFPNRVRSGPILRLPNRVWMAGERRMERLLVGHFLDRRHFHTRTMQLLVNELWHTRQPVIVVARRQNSFVFRFFSEQDMEYAMVRGPWLIRGGMLVLDYWHMFDALEHIGVRRFSMWVRLYNLPFEAFTRDAGEILGQALGDDVTVDVDDVFPRYFRYLRICISISPESTLVPGFFLDIPGGEPRWIECRYESMYKFCRACGRAGHTFPQCDLSREEASGRVDAMLNGLCEKFGSVLHTEVNASLYTNRIRAFAGRSYRRNMHMWAVREGVHGVDDSRYNGGVQEGVPTGISFGLQDNAEGATQTDLVDEHFDEVPPVMDFDQFLTSYEAAWDWGLQNPRSGFF